MRAKNLLCKLVATFMFFKSEKVGENMENLIERSKQGDCSAFSALYSQYATEIYRFALYMTGNKEDAEDAVQESLLSAWKGIHSLKDNSLFKAWLFKILSNKCKTLLMKRNKMPDTLPVEEYEFLVDYEEEGNLISSAELKEALSALTPPDAQIILLSIIGGFTSYELGVIYNMTPGAVRTRQKRALEKLKVILA
ncbi:MAG: RNA polymerase sigma factor [Ruminococcaceae bacterium]|nr:RNA polymerase sigma factor [Oscillospiraceae bacterium]